ncbi:hypothetical protein ACFYPN_16080 [Streptomyces sp. NPDC005576]|uniref:hypothetical protein n=1 Tax=Streptomyces sp. NPDC005576 TaxID=3364726 RepID=UPI00369318D7
MTPDEEVRFFAQIIGDARRTIICEPHLVDEIREVVDRAKMAGILTVKTSLACPPGQLVVIDEQAMEAEMNQAASQTIRLRGHPGCP